MMKPLSSDHEVNIAAALRALSANNVLGVLPVKALETIARSGYLVTLESEKLLFQTGDPGEAAYIVLSGELEIRTTSASGRDLRFAALGPGALVGEIAALDGGTRSADVGASRRTRLWRVSREALLDVVTSEPATALALISHLTSLLRETNRSLEQVTRLDLGGRLAALMLGERNRAGVVTLTQTELARRLGFSREKVNRKLNAWARLGWVAIRPSGVEVTQEANLRALAGASSV